MKSARAQSPRVVSVNIERLVVEGVALNPAQQLQMQRALEREMARLVESGGDWQGATAPVAIAPTLRLSEVPQPARMGREIAQCLCAAIRSIP
jgi:hypothetical protein